MKLWSGLLTIGSMICASGIIFHLQGQSIIGPDSSFMYSNPEWINYGMQIAIFGIIIAGAGAVIKSWETK